MSFMEGPLLLPHKGRMRSTGRVAIAPRQAFASWGPDASCIAWAHSVARAEAAVECREVVEARQEGDCGDGQMVVRRIVQEFATLFEPPAGNPGGESDLTVLAQGVQPARRHLQRVRGLLCREARVAQMRLDVGENLLAPHGP